ncbi:cell division protein ZapE [Lentzea xinjiangensis]|uniref:Cell division protein ZapE n=1 Tax=Lentzea xinjiangensis TaxID=402600 RepID=A0A1H9VMJ6_9PSEU|nr:cell division protein ZapE [Lentzea xinjiangensis]SES22784.1 cell division protein ZapE [Lentzea xinjiangensis]
MDLHARLLDRVSGTGYELDDAQLAAVARLAELGQRRRGVYLHGPVGRGKSFLADALFDVLPVRTKRRVHFHAFFQELHERISQRLHRRGAVAKAVRELLGRAEVLAFDEFHLHDVGDAMLMTRLLEELRQREVMIIATSNYPPDGLLPDPLYHHLFLPGIALVEQLMDTVELTGDVDYRLVRGRARSRFETGEVRAHAEAPGEPVVLDVGGRAITALGVAGGQVWFDFGDLCATPTSTRDYLALAGRFRDWVIMNVPRLRTADREARQRFANVVDVLVDADVRLTLVSDHPLREIIGGEIVGGELRDLARTASRLELINTTG